MLSKLKKLRKGSAAPGANVGVGVGNDDSASASGSGRGGSQARKGGWQEPILRAEVNAWLKKHGLPERPKQLSDAQKRDLREIFSMLDTDGSGELDADELFQAFKLLNIPTSRTKVLSLLDGDADRELNYAAFEHLMTSRINDYASSSIWEKHVGALDVSMPFSEVATAFRRKKTLEDFMSGGKARQQIIQRSEQRKERNSSLRKKWKLTQLAKSGGNAFLKSFLDSKHKLDAAAEEQRRTGDTFEEAISEIKGEIETLRDEIDLSGRASVVSDPPPPPRASPLLRNCS